MGILQSIKKRLIGTDFKVGNPVFWNNKVSPEYTGEYVVTSRCDEKGFVGIYNEKMKDRKIYWYELKHAEKPYYLLSSSSRKSQFLIDRRIEMDKDTMPMRKRLIRTGCTQEELTQKERDKLVESDAWIQGTI